MRNRIQVAAIFGTLVTLAGGALADRAVMSGGTVLEGKVTRKGGKVVVETEAGVVAVPGDSVVRIERSESSVSVFEERYRALPKGDTGSRLALADYCRDHEMRGRERQLLLEVLDLDSNNAAARARLGFVKTDAGWISRADAQRARGLVEQDGAWRSPSEALELERLRAEASARASARAAEEELAEKQEQLARDRAALEDARRADAERAAFGSQTASSIGFSRIYPGYPVYSSYPVYPGYPGYAAYGVALSSRRVDADGCFGRAGCGHRGAPRVAQPAAETYSVVKVPYRHP